MWNCKKITIRAGLREWETYGTLTRSRTLSLSTVCFNRSIFRWYLSTWLTSHSVSLSHLFGLQYMFLARLPHSRHLKHGISTEETVSAFIPYHEYQETIQRLIGYESSHMTKPKDYAFWFTVSFFQDDIDQYMKQNQTWMYAIRRWEFARYHHC